MSASEFLSLIISWPWIRLSWVVWVLLGFHGGDRTVPWVLPSQPGRVSLSWSSGGFLTSHAGGKLSPGTRVGTGCPPQERSVTVPGLPCTQPADIWCCALQDSHPDSGRLRRWTPVAESGLRHWVTEQSPEVQPAVSLVESCTDVSELPRTAATSNSEVISLGVLTLLPTPTPAYSQDPFSKEAQKEPDPWVYVTRLSFFTIQPLPQGPHCPVLPRNTPQSRQGPRGRRKLLLTLQAHLWRGF